MTETPGQGWTLDFEKIIPMPEGIQKTAALSSIEILTKDNDVEAMEERKKQLDVLREENLKNFGHESWYEWCVENWGTKWNSYNCWTLEEGCGLTIDDISNLGFQTAWAPPIPVIRALAKLTGESFRMSYYDEGWMFGGVFTCGPDGEKDEVYDNPSQIPEDSPLFEELDCAYYLDNEDEDEED
jgi:hypothetical protein